MRIKTPECKCLKCGRRMDAVGGVNTEDAPQPGDITICMRCGAIMALGDDLTLRGLTEEEMDRICADKEYMDFLARHVQQIHFFQATKN